MVEIILSFYSETDRDRVKPRRKSSRKSPEIDDQGKEDDKLQTKESVSKDEAKKEETDPEEKSDDFEDMESPDIKVKTLEEILREKALKKLEERRAQNEKVKAEEKDNMEEVYENEEKVEEGSVDQSEISEQISFRKVSPSDTFGKDDNVNATSEKTVRRKVSANNDKNWPLKKVISTVSRDDKGVKLLIKGTEDGEKAPRKDNNNDEEGKRREPPSPFQQVRVKSFEEIMELKRRRRAEKDSLTECSENADDDSPSNSTEPANSSAVVILSPPKRLKSTAKKMSSDGEKNETKAVSSSSTDSAGNRVQATRKRSVFVIEKQPIPNKKTTDNGK